MQKLLFIPLIFTTASVFAQVNLVDSLQQQLDNYTEYDENYVDLLNDISFEYIKSNPEKSPYYINLAITISQELEYEKGLIRATANKGSSYWVIGLQDESLSYYLLALTYNAKNYPLEYVRLNNNIAEVFKKKKLFDSAGKYYDRAIDMVKAKLPDRLPVILLSNMAEIFLMKDNLDSARHYYELCLKNSRIQENKRGLAYSYDGLGEIAFRKFNIDRAIDLQNNALVLRREIDDVRGIIQSLHKLGIYVIHETQFDSALVKWNEAERLALEYRALDLLNEVYLTKYEHFYMLEMYKEAADYINSYTILSDSLQSQEFVSSLNRIKGALLSEISEAENRILRQQQIRERAVNRARIITIVVLFLLISTIVFFVFLAWRRRKSRTEAEAENIFAKSLLQLSKEVNLKQPDFDEFIGDFLKTACKSLQCDRSSYWYYDEPTEQMICYKLLEKGKFQSPPKPLGKKDYPVLFKGLLSNRTIAINDIIASSYSDLTAKFITNTRIKSLLYASLFLDDKIIGFISFSTLEEIREWNFAEQRYVGSLADIIISAFAYNQSKLLENEKEELIQKLQIRNHSLREFNSVISHNLREPLTQVIGFTDILGSTLTDENDETKKIISNISNAGQRLDRAIKDLSTVLNEKDPSDKDYRLTSIAKVLKEVFDLMPNELKKYQPTITESLDIEEIITYKPFLFDILYHIIANSFKFSTPERHLTIEIASYQDGNKNYISIRDNGMGMNMEQFKDKIFKMYQRFHLNTEGRGIGLYLAKNRATSLGGDIEVKSKQGKGTEFIVSLPQSIPLNLINSDS